MLHAVSTGPVPVIGITIIGHIGTAPAGPCHSTQNLMNDFIEDFFYSVYCPYTPASVSNIK